MTNTSKPVLTTTEFVGADQFGNAWRHHFTDGTFTTWVQGRIVPDDMTLFAAECALEDLHAEVRREVANTQERAFWAAVEQAPFDEFGVRRGGMQTFVWAVIDAIEDSLVAAWFGPHEVQERHWGLQQADLDWADRVNA